MSLFSFVKRVAADIRTEVSVPDIQRIVGTLRAVGFVGTIPERHIGTAEEIVAEELKRYAKRSPKVLSSKTKKAFKVRKASSDKAALAEQYLASKGSCPRCNQAMTNVKLSNYETALYCSGCRATLWQDK